MYGLYYTKLLQIGRDGKTAISHSSKSTVMIYDNTVKLKNTLGQQNKMH